MTRNCHDMKCLTIAHLNVSLTKFLQAKGRREIVKLDFDVFPT